MTRNILETETRAHYQEYPFDFLTEKDERNIESLQTKSFLEFVREYISDDSKVAEIGCGAGRATMYLNKRVNDLFALDLTSKSIELAAGRAPQSKFIQASNLYLPLQDQVFDIVVSDGVIHHTPDPYKSFSENVRILKIGGMFYLSVYRRHRYYYYLYTYLGRPIRWAEKTTWGKFLIHVTLMPIYYVVHLFKSHGKRSWRGTKNLFYDYVITPQATFHTREEIIEWGKKNNLQLIKYDENVGNTHVFVFRKDQSSSFLN